MRSSRTVSALVLAAALAMAGCGSDSDNSITTASSPTSVTPAAAATDATTAATTTSPTAATTAATTMVDINAASIDELQAAFEAVGVDNAARWAREVDEYRPYSTDDTEYAQLRQELGKYNIDPVQLELIISTLSL